MEITWYGHSFFRLKAKEGSIVTDPYSKQIGYSVPRVTADIVTISHNHPGHNNAEAIKGEPKVIRGPGEYEVNNIFVFGIPTNHDKRNGRERGHNTVFLFEMEKLTVCHLGDLGHVLNQSQVEALGDVGVLLIPVGGTSTLTAPLAVEVVNLIDPRIVVPMHYRTPAVTLKLDSLDKFLKEIGTKVEAPQESLKITAGSLPEGTQIVVLEVKG